MRRQIETVAVEGGFYLGCHLQQARTYPAIGHSEFDPIAVGVDLAKGAAICGVAAPPALCFKMTTTERRAGVPDSGNSRSGHAGDKFYGREPTPAEKRAILEYLKSL